MLTEVYFYIIYWNCFCFKCAVNADKRRNMLQIKNQWEVKLKKRNLDSEKNQTLNIVKINKTLQQKKNVYYVVLYCPSHIETKPACTVTFKSSADALFIDYTLLVCDPVCSLPLQRSLSVPAVVNTSWTSSS